MDRFDHAPRACPIIDGCPLRWSIGFYRGRRRVVIAWFADEKSARDYSCKIRVSYPHLKVDLLKSLF